MRARLIASVLLLLLAWNTAMAQSPAAPPPASPAITPDELPRCANVIVGSACEPTAADRKQARDLYQRGRKLHEKQELREAFELFREASALVPQEVSYATAREVTRQQLVFEHMQRGNDASLAGRRVQALAAFRSALELDPTNKFAAQRVMDSSADSLQPLSPRLRVVSESTEIELRPRPGKQSFQFRGDARALWQEIGRRFGVSVAFDESVTSRRVRFNLDGVDFFAAARAAERVTKTFWSPLGGEQILVAQESTANRREFQRQSMRTFFLDGANSPQDLQEVANSLRNIFELRMVQVQPAASALLARGPTETVAAASAFMRELSGGRPQVMLEVKLFRVGHTFSRALGVNLPLQFQMFNIGAEALNLAGSPNIQEIINQLIASGLINQANNEAIAALIAQFLGQQTSIFSQPFATFGGGLTLFGLTLPNAVLTARRSETQVTELQHAMLRAGDGTPATFRAGTRYPVLNATFSPIFNSPELSRVIQTGSFQSPFPSFTYEDLGLTLKTTPQVQGQVVSLKMELEIRSLSGEAFNGVPVISTRSYSGSMNVSDGQPAVMAGIVSRSEQNSLRGIPGLVHIPVLKHITGSTSKEEASDQMLILVTPHIVRARQEGGSTIEVPRAAQ